MLDDINGTEIAIIGMASRFPGANDIHEYWRNLRDGIESVTFFSDEQLIVMGVDRAALDDSNYVKAAAQLENVELFDGAFFGINPREAEMMDPQHRFLLECAWAALENAGYNPETHKGPIAIYAGATINTYLLVNLSSNPDLLNSQDELQINIGNGGDFLTTRISYKLNLKGPSHLIQSACSTSLVAVHASCQSLLNEESDLALAGGVSINVRNRAGYRYVPGGITSPDGHCRAFDARAQGTIFGSGVGVVVLKRLADALADRDYIHAVIKGSAINNDGSLKVGYTAPSVDGQSSVIAEAIANAGIEPDTITYVEAHGTGTALGDPIEIQSLTKAFQASTDKKQFCAIGSVKTNIGHLDAAAGVASLIKTSLSLKHKLIPPSLHFHSPNPDIDFQNSPFYVNTQLAEWNSPGSPRRAGVSAFGVGGTNAHVILEEAPEAAPSSQSRHWQLLVLSARTETALEQATANLAAHLKSNPEVNLADVAYTLQVGRKGFTHRRAAACESLEDAVTVLETGDPRRLITGFEDSPDRQVVFMFPGQGSHYINMALGIYRNEPVFREQIDYCSTILKPLLGFDLRSVLYPDRQESERASGQLNQTYITQPALFVTEYALAKLLISWGIRPQAMIGHSIGEYVAACVAEVFTLEDALALVTARGQLMQQMPAGAMLAVPLPEEELQPILSDDLALAAINGLTQCVVSGPAEAIEDIQSRLSERGLVCRHLQTSHAFHSQMMDAIIEPFIKQVKKVRLRSPEIPYVSNVFGTWITEEDARDPKYWAMQLRQAVRFADGLDVLLQRKDRVMLEVGPGQSLSRLVKRHPLSTPERVVIHSLRHFNDDQPDEKFLTQALGKVWMSGVGVDWEGYYKCERRRRVELPTYPFERQRYWIEAGEGRTVGAVNVESREGKKKEIGEWYYIESWKRSLGGGGRQKKKAEEEQGGEEGMWLVMDEEGGIGEEMVRRMREGGKQVERVRRGERYEEEEGEGYRLREGELGDYERMMRRIGERGKKIRQVVHLWSVKRNEANGSEEVGSWRDQDGGFKSVLFLAQAIGKETSLPVRMTVASNNALSINGSETIQLGKSIVLGACKVIPQEYPAIACRFVDFVLDSESRRPMLVKQLLNEIDEKADDLVVAHRGNQRWVQSFEPLRLSSEDYDATVLRNKGVYLITGGLTGIGYELAKYLAKSVAARLIIVEHDELSKKIERAQALERLGAETLIASADSGNLIQMQEVVAQAFARFGSLNGVIHSAGVDGRKTFKAIQEIDGFEIERLFASKLDGLFVLANVLRGINLDFCVLNSSLSSIIGGLGSVAYSSANLFVDAFAQYHNRVALTPWISVNWDAWQFEGEEEQLTSISEDIAQLAMLPEEGGEAFRRILSLKGTDQVIISTSDLAARIEKYLKPAFRGDPLQKQSATVSAPLYPRPNLQNPYTPPASNLERDIATIWQQVLGIDRVGVQDNFFELGGDSLIAIQVAARLNNSLKIEVPVVSLYECLTIRALVEFLGNELEETSPASKQDGREPRLSRRKDYQQKQRSKKKEARS